MREDAWLDTVLETLGDLPARQREVYLLIVGLNPDGTQRAPSQFFEIAKALGISKQAVRFRFLEADAKVSKALFKHAITMMSSPT